MDRLTTEQVNTASAALTARANTAIEGLQQQKSMLGWATGNNDTVQSTIGALTMIKDTQIPPWRQNGYDIVAADDDSKVDGWANVGQEFSKAITEIDGYGRDATLESVLHATASKTAADIKDKALPALSFGLGLGLVFAAVAIAIYFGAIIKR